MPPIAHAVGLSHVLTPTAAVLAACVAFIRFAHSVRRRPALRKRITSNPLWKVQFALHPVVVGGMVCISQLTSNPWWALALCPFVFNFGVEPWDLPESFIFFGCFYAHHVAPLLACLLQQAGSSPHAGAEDASSFALAQGLVFGHVWLLHTIGTLEKWRIIDKQRWFWPYMVEGALLKLLWFGSVSRLQLATLLPLFVQFAGRWGLYAYLMRLMGWPKPGDEFYDAFEQRKLPAEFAALILAAGYRLCRM